MASMAADPQTVLGLFKIMYVPDDEFKKLCTEVKDIRERIIGVEAARGSNWKEYIGLGALILAVFGGAIALNTRITKLQSAVTAIANRQPADTQNLVRDLLAAATATTNPTAAAKALDVATQLTTTLRNEKRPAPADFFQATIATANQNKNPSLDPRFCNFKLNWPLIDRRYSRRLHATTRPYLAM
jgi:hypothetical protein